jgi:ubiquinone/menaquinone biosynthesis C-methylase UbiE
MVMTAVIKAREEQGLSAEALIGRLFEATLGALDLFTIYLGDRLGYYEALAGGEAMTSGVLARKVGANERYTREWLEQQAVTGILIAEEQQLLPADRRYRLPQEYLPLLVDQTSLLYGMPMAKMSAGVLRPVEQVIEAYRNGGGVSFADYGVDVLTGQAAFNRPQFDQFLGSEWIPAMPDIDERLRKGRPARVADIGMGAGWSSIAFVKAYPNVLVAGFDSDAASVELARRNAAEAGVDDRVSFSIRDAGDPDLAGAYDLATAFECIHDMPNPVAALATMRRLVGEGGTALVMDERVEDEFSAPGGEIERFMYACSVLHCLPVGMAGEGAAGTGTVMRRRTFEAYAEAAGFQRVEVLPIESHFFRFYRLTA